MTQLTKTEEREITLNLTQFDNEQIEDLYAYIASYFHGDRGRCPDCIIQAMFIASDEVKERRAKGGV